MASLLGSAAVVGINAASSGDQAVISAHSFDGVGASGIAVLHRHTLGSVLGFFALAELPSMLRVCKEWSAAVHSMRPLTSSKPYFDVRGQLRHVCSTLLARHVSSLNVSVGTLSAADLSTLTAGMPFLHTLSCTVQLSDTEAEYSEVALPKRLRSVSLRFALPPPQESGSAVAAAAHPSPDAEQSTTAIRQCTAVINCVAALPELDVVSLSQMPSPECMAPLAHASTLRILQLQPPGLYGFYDEAAEQLRAMTQVTACFCRMTPEAFCHLTRAPHQLKLHRGQLPVQTTAEVGAALARLPTLVEAEVTLDCEHADFLMQLPVLSNLTLGWWSNSKHVPDSGRVLQALQSCSQLTKLRLWADACGGDRLNFTTEQLSSCLLHLPLLRELTLQYLSSVRSLRFLTEGSLPRTLLKLRLEFFHPRLLMSELEHVNALTALDELSLYCMFEQPLDDATQRLYKPPSVLLPALRLFSYYEN